jgi:RNA polymerase sigma-70 factor (ECF subfamily)
LPYSIDVRLSLARRAVHVANAELHVPRMLSVARSILGSDDLAWDAVQDALMSLWHERDAPPDLAGWLVRATTLRALHHARSLRRRRSHEGIAARLHAELDEPDDAPERRELALLLAGAIRALPGEFREVFVARELDERSCTEIASELGIAAGTVKSRLHRAKALLRRALAELVHDEAACARCARGQALATGRSAPGPRW